MIVKSSRTFVWSSNNHSHDGDICNLQPANWDNNRPILLWQGARRDWGRPLHRSSLLHPRPGEGSRQPLRILCWQSHMLQPSSSSSQQQSESGASVKCGDIRWDIPSIHFMFISGISMFAVLLLYSPCFYWCMQIWKVLNQNSYNSKCLWWMID